MGEFDDLIPAGAAKTGVFDDLIPSRAGGGLFADLIPQPTSTPRRDVGASMPFYQPPFSNEAEPEKLGPPRWYPPLTERIAGRWQAGRLQADADNASYAAMMGQVSPDVARAARERAKDAAGDQNLGSDNIVAQGLLGAVGMLPPMLEGTAEGAKYGAALGALGGAVGAVPGAVAGVAAGLPSGAVQYWYRQGAGSMYGDLVDEGIDHKTAASVASVFAGPYAAIELAQVERLLPGAKGAFRGAVKGGVREALARLAAQKGKDYAAEITQEEAQELIQIAAEGTARTLAGKERPEDALPIKERLLNTFAETAKSVPFLMLPGGAVDTARAVWEGRRQKAEGGSGEALSGQEAEGVAPTVEGVDYLPAVGSVDPVEELIEEGKRQKAKGESEVVPGPDYQPMEGQPFEEEGGSQKEEGGSGGGTGLDLSGLEAAYSDDQKYHAIVPEITTVDPRLVLRRDGGETATVSDEVAKAMKFDEPIRVSLFADGTLKLSDGHHRLAAAKQLGMQRIPAIVQAINAKGKAINELIRGQAVPEPDYEAGLTDAVAADEEWNVVDAGQRVRPGVDAAVALGPGRGLDLSGLDTAAGVEEAVPADQEWDVRKGLERAPKLPEPPKVQPAVANILRNVAVLQRGNVTDQEVSQALVEITQGDPLLFVPGIYNNARLATARSLAPQFATLARAGIYAGAAVEFNGSVWTLRRLEIDERSPGSPLRAEIQNEAGTLKLVKPENLKPAREGVKQATATPKVDEKPKALHLENLRDKAGVLKEWILRRRQADDAVAGSGLSRWAQAFDKFAASYRTRPFAGTLEEFAGKYAEDFDGVQLAQDFTKEQLQQIKRLLLSQADLWLVGFQGNEVASNLNNPTQSLLSSTLGRVVAAEAVQPKPVAPVTPTPAVAKPGGDRTAPAAGEVGGKKEEGRGKGAEELPEFAKAAGVKSWEHARKLGLQTIIKDAFGIAQGVVRAAANWIYGSEEAAAQYLAREIVERVKVTGGKQTALRELANDYYRKAEGATEPNQAERFKATAAALGRAEIPAVTEQPKAVTPVDTSPPQASQPPAVAAEVRKAEVVKEKQAVAPMEAKAQKKFLLEEIDKALAEAPDVEVTPYPVQGKESAERRRELEKQYAAALAADKARVGTVTIEVPGDGTFEILNTRKALQAFKAKAAKFPTTVPKKGEPSRVRETPTAAPVVGKLEPTAALKAARLVVSEDTSWEVIHHVWSDGQQSVATDGRRMMIVQAGNGGTAKEPVLVREDGKTEPAKDRGKNAKGEEKRDWPDWRQVVPKESIERGKGLDTGRLWTVLKQALAVWIGHKEPQHSVTLVHNRDGSIGLMTSAPEAGEYVHNVQPGWQSITAVKGEYLADGLAGARMVGNEKVTISWTDEMAPVVIDGKGFKYVLMPMRLNGGDITEVAKQEAERVAKMEALAGDARGEGTRQKAKGERQKETAPAADKSVEELFRDGYRQALKEASKDARAQSTVHPWANEAVRKAGVLGMSRSTVYQDLVSAGIRPEVVDVLLRGFQDKSGEMASPAVDKLAELKAERARVEAQRKAEDAKPRRNGLRSAKALELQRKVEELDVEIKRAADGTEESGTDKLIAKLEGMKSAKHRGEVGAFNLPGISEAMWNTALDAGIGLLKAGRAIGEAIDAVVAKLRELGADFDEANVRQAVAIQLGEEPLREHAIKQLHAGNRNAAVQAAILAASTREVRSDEEVDAAVAGIIREAGGAEAALPVVNDVRLPLDTRYALALAIANQINDEIMRLTGQQPAGWLAESNRLAKLVGEFLGEFIPTTTETARGLRQLGRLKALGRQTPIGWDAFARTTIENVNAEQRARLAPVIQALIEELNRLNVEVARATAETKAVQDAARQAAEAAVKAEAERQGSALRNAMVIETTNSVELLPSVRKAKAAATVKALQKIGGAGYWQGLVNKGQQALLKAIEQALNGAGARVNAVTVAEIAQLMTKVLRQQVDATLGTAAQRRQGLPALMKLRVLFGANERMSDFWKGVRGQLANELTEKYGERPEIEALLGQTMDVWSGPLVRAAMKEVLAEQETTLAKVIQEHLRGVGTGSIEAARATLAAKIVEAVGLDEQTGQRLARAVEAEFDAEMKKQQGKLAERLRKAEERRRMAAAGQPRRRAEAIVRQFAKSQSDTLSWMGPKVTDAIREAVTEQVRDGALTEEAFAAKLEGLGVPADVAATLAATTQRERTIRQAIEAEEDRQAEAEAPTKRAGQILRKFAASQSDTLAWSRQTEDAVGAAVQRQLAADVAKGHTVATEAEFADELESLGVKPAEAATLAAVVMRERAVREANRAARAAQAKAKREAAAPTKAAERIVATLAKSQSDTLRWQKTRQGAVQRLVQHQISKRAWTDAVFRKLLERLGVKPAAAATLTQVVAREIEVRNRLAQELMFGEDAIDKAIRKALAATGQKLGEIVRTHHSEQAGVGKRLAERLVAEAGLTGPAAERLAAAVEGRFRQLAEQRKRKVVEQMTKPRTARELRKRSVADRIIEASNLGALDEATTWAALAEKLGLAVYTPEHSAEVRRRAELLQRLPVGSVQHIQATARLLAYIAKAHGVKASELAWAVWYANTLSGPMTHLVNSVSNMASLGSGTVAAMRGNPLALPRVVGALLHGFRVGGLEAGAVLRYGSEAKRAKFDPHQHALELLGPEAFTGARLVAGLKYVGRALAAADALFYFPAREVKTVQLAHALARGEGLRGAELARRRDDVLHGTDAQEADWRAQIGREAAGVEAAGMPADRLWRARRLQQLREENRPGAMVESADDFALKVTFNNQPTGLMGLVSGWASQATRQLPAARLVVPFINIVGNVVNESLNYTPWGFARGAAAGRNGVPSVLATFNEAARRGSVPVTPDAVIDLHAKAALGTLLFAGLALAAAAGGGGDDDGRRFQINGAGTRRADGKMDAEKLKALKAAGWIPYSVRVGGRYYSFTSTPLAVPLAILGNYLDEARFNPKEWEQTQALDRAVFALWSSASVFAQMSFIDSAARLMGWVHDGGRPKKMGDNLVEVVGRSAGSIVIPNALRQLDRMQDPTVYDGRGLAGAIAASVPFARRANEVALNAVGEPVAASPWARFASDAKPGIMQELAAHGLWIAVPSADDVLPDLGRKLEPAEFHQYVKLSGEMIRKALAEDGQWRRLDAENAQKLVGEHVAESRHRARVLLGFEAPVDLPKAPKPYVPPVRLFGR